MDRIGVVGTSYRTTTVENLALAALPADLLGPSLTEIARLSGFSEFVYLGTCNRVEFYFRGETEIHTGPLLFHLRRSLADLTDGGCQLPDDDSLYIHVGRDAVRHLFRVTSALDSMMVGEAQIAGQAKQAHELAHDLGLLGGILDQTFHEAFNLAKRVRTETELAKRPVSLVTLVERALHEHLASSSAPALIIGAGEMAAQSLRLIRSGEKERRVLVANRTPARAEAMVAGDPAALPLPLDSALADPPAACLVVVATSSENIVVDRAMVASMRERLAAGQKLLVIDLAMPPNVAPEVAEIGGVELHGIEQMREEAERNRQLRMAEMDRCERLVDHQLHVLRRRMLDRALSPVAQTLAQSFNQEVANALERSFAKELAHLAENDREAIERLGKTLAKRLVQVPLRGLKGAAWQHSSAVLDGFLSGLHGSNGMPPEEDDE